MTRGARTSPEQSAPGSLLSGIITVKAIYVDCPYCHEALASPKTGSELLIDEDLHTLIPGHKVECFHCGKNFRMPYGANALRSYPSRGEADV